MMDIIRDSSLGQLLRFITGNRILKYREENSDFNCPGCYVNNKSDQTEKALSISRGSHISAILVDEQRESQPPVSNLEVEEPLPDSESTSEKEGSDDIDIERRGSATGATFGLWKIPTQAEIQRTYSQHGQAERAVSRPIVPVKTSDGTVLVDWWTTGNCSQGCI